MTKPRLNKRQRNWLNNFIALHPGAFVTSMYGDLTDRTVTINWTEKLPYLAVPDCSNMGYGYIRHTIRVILRVMGDPRREPQHKYEIVYPYCNLDDNRERQAEGQLNLTIPQNTIIPTPANPVKVKSKRQQKTPDARKSKPVWNQYKLPLFGVAAQLHQIQFTETSTVISEQELLLEAAVYRDVGTGKETNLPTAIIKILKEKKATLDEWETAIALYQVTESQGVIKYLEGLESLRKNFGKINL